MNDCPSCGASLHNHATTCKGCGWKLPQAQRATEADPMAHCCAWTAGQRRCHYPGTMAHAGSGDRRWYCSGHMQCTQAMGAAILEQSHKDVPHPDYSHAGRMALAEKQAEKRRVGYLIAHEARQICKLSTPDERRSRISSFESKQGTHMANRVREAVRSLWESRKPKKVADQVAA